MAQKLLIELGCLHICFVANMFVFENIIGLFSNTTLENGVFSINTKIQEKNQDFVYGFCFWIFHTDNLHCKKSGNKYLGSVGQQVKLRALWKSLENKTNEKTWFHKSFWWNSKYNNWRQFLVIWATREKNGITL